MNMAWSANTQLAMRAARQGGKAVLELYRKKATPYTIKSDKSPVTIADIQSNNIIGDMLSSHTDYPILSEEGADDTLRLDAEYVWVVDPLDGTADFINNTDEFTIMISLVYNNTPIMGVIDCPSINSTYVAELGKGAWIYHKHTWRQVRVSKVRDIAKCRALVSRSHYTKPERDFVDNLCLGAVQSKGSSLKVTEISSAKAEIYITFTNKMKEWDTAASHIILREAGGTMSDMAGNPLSYNEEDVFHNNGILATNGHTHNFIVESYLNYKKTV